ncbi:uncharacterized protein EAF01_002058 [Botrytis porri]|uniref:uncharacterized protein n=1 Tax=Botrytis porri TaxID=87229 RepID=UPI001901DEB4|nr:uncharacterized protein EAF01_002058 [Botrytis porri]KAF7913037.1 hypothetical protein EAF01_002058 [Botrytis porri]
MYIQNFASAQKMESDLFSLGTMSIGAKEACLEFGHELRSNSQLKFNVITHLMVCDGIPHSKQLLPEWNGVWRTSF